MSWSKTRSLPLSGLCNILELEVLHLGRLLPYSLRIDLTKKACKVKALTYDGTFINSGHKKF
jgi:hypothetical protein